MWLRVGPKMDQTSQITSTDQQIQASRPPNASSGIHEEEYKSILDRINGQSADQAELALRFIGWIAYAERPLAFEEIRQAFAFENERIDKEKLSSLETQLLQVCCGLVILDDGDGADAVFKLFHPSAYIGIFRNETGNLEKFQEDIARTCLGYLCLHEMQEGPCGDVESLAVKLFQMPFLAYAAQYWGTHAQRVEQQVESLIRKLLGDPRLRSGWFEALQYSESKDPELAHPSLEYSPSTGPGLLNVAAFSNLSLTAQDVLFAGSYQSSTDSEGWTPLHWACRNGHTSIVGVLLNYEADLINVTDLRGWTPLFWAIFSGNTGIVQLLLNDHADHLVVDIQGWTVLHWAVSVGQEGTVRALLAYHHDFVAREEPDEVLLKDVTFGKAQEIKRYAGQKTSSDDVAPIEIAAREHNVVLFDVLLQDIALGNAEYAERCSKVKWPEKPLSVDLLQSFNRMWSSKKFDRQMFNDLSKQSKEEKYFGTENYLKSPLLPESLHSRALHVAIRDENMMIVRLLLELGADVNYNATEAKRAPLHTSAFRKAPEFARILLQNGADPILTDDYGQSPLHHAILNGFDETVTVLMEHGSDVNARTAAGETPLMLACGRVDELVPLGFVQDILARGASASSKDDNGRTALHLALQHCQYGLAKELLAAGADANATAMSGETVFHYFAQGYGARIKDPCEDTRIQEILDLLLDSCHEGTENKTFLRWREETHSAVSLALASRHWKQFNSLIQRGAKLHPDADLGKLLETALWACEGRAVEFLLQQGAKLDFTSHQSMLLEEIEYNLRTRPIDSFAEFLQMVPAVFGIDANLFRLDSGALLMAAKLCDSARAIQLLIYAGADIYYVDDYGYDAFLIAGINGKHDSLRCLLENKAKRPSKDHWLHVPDSFQLHSPDEALDSLLCTSLRTSGKLEIKNSSDQTPLQRAIEIGSVGMVKKLIGHGADIETRGYAFWSPLHNAVYNKGPEAIIDALLDAKADISAATRRWSHADCRPSGLYTWSSDPWTGQPLHLAAMFARESVVQKLLEHGADVHASTGTEEGVFPGHGPTALHIVLDTGLFYNRVGEVLDESRLRIAELLVERGAVVDGVAEHLELDDVLKFGGFEQLWDRLRVGISEERGRKCWTYLYRESLRNNRVIA